LSSNEKDYKLEEEEDDLLLAISFHKSVLQHKDFQHSDFEMCNYDTLYHAVNEEEKPAALDVFDDCSYVLYGKDSYDNQAEIMHSSFQYECEENVSDFQFSEIFPSQPIFDEYSDDNLDILELDVFIVT
jgi:hypothetical protein